MTFASYLLAVLTMGEFGSDISPRMLETIRICHANNESVEYAVERLYFELGF